MSWYFEVLKKYAVFSGRARRKEYWMFVLFNTIISIVLGIIDEIARLYITENLGILSTIYTVAVLLPSLAVAIRRLHDTDHSGWWLFIALIPFIGAIILIIFYVQDSQFGENRFGPNPKIGYSTANSLIDSNTSVNDLSCPKCGKIFPGTLSGKYDLKWHIDSEH